MGLGLRDQRPNPMALLLLNLPHLDGQRDLGGRIDQEKHVPALHRDLDVLHPAPLILEAPRARHLATAPIAVGGHQIGAIGNSCDPLAKDPGLGQGPNRAIEHPFQVPHVQLHDLLGQGVRAEGSWEPLALLLASPTLAHPLGHLRRIEAYQLHEGFITAQQTGQGIDALNAKQGLQPIE
jgi:hypothetical protein